MTAVDVSTLSLPPLPVVGGCRGCARCWPLNGPTLPVHCDVRGGECHGGKLTPAGVRRG